MSDTKIGPEGRARASSGAIGPVGPTGPTGAGALGTTGPTGATGTAGPDEFLAGANVAGDGSNYQTGFASINQTGTGTYVLVLNVVPASPVAVVSPQGDLPGFVTAEVSASDSTITVLTFDSTGTPANRSFCIAVFEA